MPELRKYLHRYWFRWHADEQQLPSGAALGYGVTAVHRADAAALVRLQLFGGEPLPGQPEVLEYVDVRELDANHVLPNMGDPSIRGVWYP